MGRATASLISDLNYSGNKTKLFFLGRGCLLFWGAGGKNGLCILWYTHKMRHYAAEFFSMSTIHKSQR